MPWQAEAKGNPKYASIVMDADTGLILHQRYADKSLHPASLTKVMTLLMVFEALEAGTLQLNERIHVSKHAAGMVPSKLGLKAGSSIRVRDAIYALVTKSANDVAVALAEHLGKTEWGFANKMTMRAREIGMKRTTFKNASGLHHKRQVSTARDMAKMARYVINTYPEYYRYFSRKKFSYAGKTYRNHNRLMNTYNGMDGMKTGYIAASGFNLIGSAVRNNRRIIGVVFGGRTSKTRNAHMKVLLDRGFSKLNDIRIARADVPVPDRKPAVITTIAALKDSRALQLASADTQKWTNINEQFGRLIGEGDFDPAVSRRINAGALAIAAYRGDTQSKTAKSNTANAQKAQVQKMAMTAPAAGGDTRWAIQVGAFTSRAATDRAIQDTLRALPRAYAHAQPAIAPLRAGDNWLFRARLSGYTRAQALAACDLLKECMPVAPRN